MFKLNLKGRKRRSSLNVESVADSNSFVSKENQSTVEAVLAEEKRSEKSIQMSLIESTVGSSKNIRDRWCELTKSNSEDSIKSGSIGRNSSLLRAKTALDASPGSSSFVRNTPEMDLSQNSILLTNKTERIDKKQSPPKKAESKKKLNISETTCEISNESVIDSNQFENENVDEKQKSTSENSKNAVYPPTQSIASLFKNDRVLNLRHGDAIVLKNAEGNYVKLENGKSELKCKNQQKSSFVIQKAIFSTKDQFIYNNEKITLTSKSSCAGQTTTISQTLSIRLNPPQNSPNPLKIPFGAKVSFRAAKSDTEDHSIWTIFHQNSLFKSIKPKEPQKLKFLYKASFNPKGAESELIEKIIYSLNGVLSEEFITAELRQSSAKDVGLVCKLAKLGVEKSLLFKTERFLEAIADVHFLKAFSAERSDALYGQVSGAFCSSIDALFSKFSRILCALDCESKRGHLSLQQLWLCVQPAAKLFSKLRILAAHVLSRERDPSEGLPAVKGGALFNEIHKLFLSEGDQQIQRVLFFHVVRPSFGPYAKMLGDWVFRGEVNDPQAEFMVAAKAIEHPIDFSDQFWKSGHALSAEGDGVPVFLRGARSAILRAGKFVRLLRRERRGGEEVGAEIESMRLDVAEDDFAFERFVAQIRPVYEAVSARLVGILVKEERLPDWVRLTQKIFFMSRGDFYFDISGGASCGGTGGLQSVLGKTLGECSVLGPMFPVCSQNFKITLWRFNFVEKLQTLLGLKRGVISKENFDAFGSVEPVGFVFDAKWPLDLFFTKSAMFRYNLLFRYIFLLKRIETKLGENWCKMKQAKKLQNRSFLPFSLQQKSVHFFRSLLFFIQNYAVESGIKTFFAGLHSKNLSFDGVIAMHEDFLSNLFNHLLLKDWAIFKCILAISEISLKFCHFMDTLWAKWQIQKLKFVNTNFSGKFQEKSFAFNKQISVEMAAFFESLKAEAKLKELHFLFDLNARDLLRKLQGVSPKNFAVFALFRQAVDFNFYFSNKSV